MVFKYISTWWSCKPSKQYISSLSVLHPADCFFAPAVPREDILHFLFKDILYKPDSNVLVL